MSPNTLKTRHILSRRDKIIFGASLAFFVASILVAVIGYSYSESLVEYFYPDVAAPDNWALLLTLIGRITLTLILASFILCGLGLFQCIRKHS